MLYIWKNLEKLGIKNSVVTSSRKDIFKAYLTKVGLISLCNFLVCINHVKNPKPSPNPYLLCIKNFNRNIANCITVENSITGIHSSVNAGIKMIAWVNDINKFSRIGANIVILV